MLHLRVSCSRRIVVLSYQNVAWRVKVITLRSHKADLVSQQRKNVPFGHIGHRRRLADCARRLDGPTVLRAADTGLDD